MFISSFVFCLSLVGGLSAPVDDPVRVDLPVYDQPEAASDIRLAHPLVPESNGDARSDQSLVGNLVSQKLHAATNLLSHKLNTHAVQAGTLNAQGAGGWFGPPVTTLEGVLLESEGLGSKALSVKDNLHHIVAGLFQVWTDKKYLAKKAAAAARKSAAATGGGPSTAPQLSQCELKVISIMGEGFGEPQTTARVPAFDEPKPIVDTIKEEEKYGNSGDKFYSAGRAVVGGAENVSNLVNSILEVPGTIIKKITRAASEKLNNFGGRLIGL